MNSISSRLNQRDVALHDLLHVEDDFLTTPATRTVGIHRIMVPSDFSPGSINAVRYARYFARHFSADLLLVHVRDVSQSAPGYYPYEEVRQSHEAMVKSVLARLAALAEKSGTGDSAPITCRYMVAEGEPVSEIVGIARDNDVDMLIISAHAYAGYRYQMGGGVADKIIHLAPCPVLSVRESDHDFIPSKEVE